MDTDIFSSISSTWSSFTQSNFLYYVKIISALASTILFIDIILLLNRRIKTDWRISLYGTPYYPRIKKSLYVPRWEAIREKLEEKSIASGKVALVEADKLLDEALNLMGKVGQDTAEKLAAVKPGQMVGIDDVREVHKLSLAIREDPTYEAGWEEIRTALAAYERIFRGLGMID